MEVRCACGAPLAVRGNKPRGKTGLCQTCANPPQWPQSDVDALCDLMADNCSYQQAAARLGRSKDAVVSRWRKIVRSMGAQAI